MRYFGYCTLLDITEMRKFCPTAEPLVTARLPGYRVGFALYDRASGAGGCNLEVAEDKEVLGLLYEVTTEELAGLDAISGVDRGYYERIEVVVSDDQGRDYQAVTYIIPSSAGSFRPPASYTRPIFAGARARGFPAAYIRQLEEAAGASGRA